ncbi:MAG: ATP-binding protein, partial [Cyclobacteriaceae bacterium]|nr:ATP-binding protein [Cyclobacteriaceae bacterium]
NNPQIFFEDSKNRMWIGYNVIGALDRYDELNEDLIHYSVSDADDNIIFGRNSVSSILEDTEGRIWIGTNYGVFALAVDQDTTYNALKALVTVKNYMHFSERNGLASNEIVGLLSDAHNRLWVSTSTGLSLIDPKTNEIKNYDESDGLQKGRFNAGSLLKTREGIIYFGGVNGLSIFDPDSIRTNETYPPIYITDLKIHYKSLSAKNDESGNDPVYLQKAVHLTKEITLPFDQNSITIEFAALNYIASLKNLYAYTLINFDKDWNYAAIGRSATYTNINPGTYTFKVKASNNDGVWNEEGTSLVITILPPPWKTWWAYSGYAIVFILLLTVGRNEIVKREQLKSKAKLKEAEAEKYQELDTLKSRFFANISHEFRTPLTLILAPLDKRIAAATETTEKNELTMMRRNATRLLTLVNQLLELSRLEAGTLKLNIRTQSLHKFITYIASQFSSMADSRAIHFELRADHSIELSFDPDKLEKIVTNVLSNAFKFTPSGGAITISLSQYKSTPHFPEGYAQIIITDSGSGIEAQHIERIFDRFYQVDTSSTREYEGSGIGLALAKELVELHKGSISVASTPGVGSSFTIQLPLGTLQMQTDDVVESFEAISTESPSLENDSTISEKVAEEGLLPKLLIVEDNSDLRSYLRNILDGYYEIHEASDGEHGLAIALELIPDLILTDLMMPKVDGLQLCGKLKGSETTSHIPIMLLTAKADIETKLEGLNTGADDYLAKPFDARELKSRIHNLIEIRRKLQKKFSNQFSLAASEIKVDSLDTQFLKKVKQTIEDRIGDPSLSVESLSEEIAMSNVQLYRKLKALTGMTANELIRNIRLDRAASLLKQHAGNVSEVAFQVGFNNLSYFAKCFKEKFNVSPSAFTSSFKN